MSSRGNISFIRMKIENQKEKLSKTENLDFTLELFDMNSNKSIKL